MLKLLKLLERISPYWAALIIYQFLSRPKKRPVKQHETQILDKAEKQTMLYQGKRITGYVWGKEEQPIVMLIHGWEGRAGNFGSIVTLLHSLGYCVIAYDGPAHGTSEVRGTSMFSYAHFVNDRIGAINPKIIITHSFGSVPTMMALSQLENLIVEQVISITTPYDFRHFLDRTMTEVGLSDGTKKELIQLIEKRDAVDMTALNMTSRAALLKVQPKITIIHSEDDKVLPISESYLTEKALPNAALIPLKNEGHYSILWAEETLQIIRKLI